MIRKEVSTYTASVYVSGPQQDVERICREFVMRGLCVTVEPVEFIYTGGQERGVRVGLINYPRFPSTREEIKATAEELAEALVVGLHQHSGIVVATDLTAWLTRREQNA